ncbi:MAG: peptidoglycan DD-metalloendopeptidase family protein [bacterium]|nr:peptidoglycan DD-metalloendopeptidase family protein [bacterium]
MPRLEVVSAAARAQILDRHTAPLPADVVERARRVQAELETLGLLDPTQSSASPKLVWPLRQRAGYDHPGVWAAVRFVDHDSRLGFLLDYQGGERTYDLTEIEYNHQGTDLLAWPFGWAKTALAQVEVVAAAAGRIVERIDGNFDQECGRPLEEERTANLVVIAHSDGSIAIYGHLKRGSLSPKQIGDRVEAGEYLGAVASSGQSSYAHLHLEIWGAAGDVIDPFAGPHNPTVDESWWQSQPPYYESGFLAVMTHSAEPTVACNYEEKTWRQDRFEPGEDVYLASFLRDLRRGQKLRIRVLDPDGAVVARSKYRARDPHWAIYPVSHRLALPADAPPGRWTFRAKFEGSTLEESFEVGDFETEAGVLAVKPAKIRAGKRRKLKIRGFGFDPKLAAYVTAPAELGRHLEIVRARVRDRKVTLTIAVDEAASPGPRTIVLTAPDYSQLVIENAFRVATPSG